MQALNAALSRIGGEMDRRFDTLLAVLGDPRATLFRAIRHAAIGGSVRLRPLLVSATANLFGVEDECAARVALAIECVHVYSLIHDALPAMEDGERRCGKPSVHSAFGEAAAVLAGDCLHAIAFELLADPLTHPDPAIRAELVLELARAAGPAGMAGGKMMDRLAEPMCCDLNTVTRLEAMKTGAMIRVSVEAGAILGGVAPADRTGLRGYAHDIALALRIADDLCGCQAHAADTAQRRAAGPRRARAQAAMLIDQAIEHLRGYGPAADMHRAIARSALGR